MTCPDCENAANRGFNYCDKCGAPINGSVSRIRRPKENVPLRKTLMNLVKIVTLISVSVVFVLGTISLVMLIPDMLKSVELDGIRLFILTPFPSLVSNVDGIVGQVYLSVVIVAAVVAVALLFYKSIRNADEPFMDRLESTPLFEVSALFAINFLLNIVIIFVITYLGIDIGRSGDVDINDAVATFNAIVYEEFLTRICIIGIPMAMICWYEKRNSKEALKNLGGGFGLNRIVFVLIIISALIFAVAHYPSWGLWKVFPTFIMGAAAGYLFSKYGWYADVCLHFMFNISAVIMMFGGTGTTVIITLIFLLCAVMGIPLLVKYVIKCVRTLPTVLSK